VAGEGTGHVAAVEGVAGVGRVAHAVEALALVVGDLLAGAVGFARRLDPHVGVDARLGGGLRALAQFRPGLVAPVAGVEAAVDAPAVPASGPRSRDGELRALGIGSALITNSSSGCGYSQRSSQERFQAREAARSQPVQTLSVDFHTESSATFRRGPGD